MSDRNPDKRGKEINGFDAKVVVAMDARLHESLCRLAQRRGQPLARYVRDELQGLTRPRSAYWPSAGRSRSILTIAEEGEDGALS